MAAQEALQIPDLPAGQVAGQVAVAGPISPGFAIADGGFGIAMAFPGPPVTGASYSAETSTETVQTLADGNRIDRTTTGTVARDSQGRTRVEHTLPSMANVSRNSGPKQFIIISDPVAGYTYMLDPLKEVAHRMPVKMGPVTAQAFQAKLQSRLEKAASPDGETFTKTDLGTQPINGVSAQGTEITRTIPAGAIGNESPIASTTETWYSPDLKIVVMSKTDDPRMGETTYNLTNIVRSEPAADLFQVPSNYTIQNGPPMAVVSYKKAH
jgi:hypothetical protein